MMRSAALHTVTTSLEAHLRSRRGLPVQVARHVTALHALCAKINDGWRSGYESTAEDVLAAKDLASLILAMDDGRRAPRRGRRLR